MSHSIILLLYFVTGISFAFGTVNLVIGSQKGGERSYFLFGLIGILVGGYYLTYLSAGNEYTYDLISKTGFLFFISAFALLPWFFSHYSGYKNRYFQWILSLGMGLTYLLLVFTKSDSPILIWNIVGHIFVLGIIIFGFISARYQINSGHKLSGWYLFIALIPFLILTIDDIIYVHFNSIYPFDPPEGFLPFDYFPVLFMIIMGIKLARDIQHHIYLQKEMIVKDKRWGDLLEKVQLLVVSLDNAGHISYANPCFLKITGYNSEDIIGKDWFALFLPGEIKSKIFGAYKEHLENDTHPHFKNTIVKRNREEIIVDWSNVQIIDQHGNVTGSLSIGADITEREEAFIEITELKNRLEKENIDLKEKISEVGIPSEIIGKSDEIRYAIQRAVRVAPTDSSVLLEGETGVGKELFAELIHKRSLRNAGPLIKVNCTALPRELIESELFGHEKGAFTGAISQKKGRFELADKGTIFLDEISELPIGLQPKLLRVLQNGEFERIGGQKTLKVDVRVISATNRNLDEHIKTGNFREDLFYRLNVYPITVPPLRSRKGDIQILVNHFVMKLNKKMGKTFKTISKHDTAQLQKYHWPGNVRELENMVERTIITSEEPNLKFDLGDISKHVENNRQPLKKSLQDAERDHIISILEECDWKINGKDGAADKLNLPPSTLRSKMKKLNIIRPE